MRRIAKEADAGHVHVPHTPLREEQHQRRGVVQALQLAKKTEPFILDVVDVVQQTGAVPAWADEVAELVQEDVLFEAFLALAKEPTGKTRTVRRASS
jgi:hypothetical protein